MDTGPLNVWPVTLRRSVVDGQHQAWCVGDQGLDEFQQQGGGDALCSFAGRRHGRVTAPELVGQLCGSNPRTERSPPACQDGSQKQARQTRSASRIEYACQGGKPLAPPAGGVRGCHGRVRSVVRWSCGNAIVPDGPALVYFRSRDSRSLPISSRKVQDQNTPPKNARTALGGFHST